MKKDIVLGGVDLNITQSNELNNYLTQLGLPSENIIAEIAERKVIGSNLPSFISNLDPAIKQDARYLSKFTVAAAVGLFDASLNYIWNEVVLNLRQKALIYGLDMFFDAAVGGERREFYKTEEDLKGLKDNALINTCRKLELISDVTNTKLHHILTMRNDIGASHPTESRINGFELLGWLQVCVQDVLLDKPSESAIRIKSFVENLKKSTEVISEDVMMGMEKPLRELSLQNTDNLINSIFGIYVSSETSNIVRKNISICAPRIWSKARDEVKYKIGIKLDGYKNNLQEGKFKFGAEFLEFCDGNQYRSLESRIISLDTHADDLLDARYAWDNFHHEPSHMRKLLSFIKTESDIPKERVFKIIKNIMVCRVGKGVSYNSGVSPAGKPLYDNFFSMLGDENIIWGVIAMHSNEVSSWLENKYCQKNMIEILNIFKSNARSERIREILDFLIARPNLLSKIHNDVNYKDLTKNHIQWS